MTGGVCDFSGFLRGLHRERGPGRQRSGGELSPEQDRRCQECVSVFPLAPAALGVGGCLRGGVTERRQCRLSLQERRARRRHSVRAASPPPRFACRRKRVTPPSQHYEEDQHDQQDRKEDGDGTPLAPICKAGHED